MQLWKFLLVGITGNLSELKILPALAQFASLHETEVAIDLIGFSRSEADRAGIEKLIEKHSVDGVSKIRSIDLYRGSYDDTTIVQDLLQNQQDNERLVMYLAVPPQVFLSFLDKSCPYSDKPLDIIIEKPFGKTKIEAYNILEKISQCHLYDNVHFSDHYLFKTPTFLSKQEKDNLKFLKEKRIKRISVNALETVTAAGRGGYYDSNGALKDMLPAHLYSLATLASTMFDNGVIKEWVMNYNITDVVLGQYKSYLSDLNIAESNTDTYFKVTGTVDRPDDSFELVLESGKALGRKLTSIRVDFEDGSELFWHIDPNKCVELANAPETFYLNLDKNNKHDHTNLFEKMLNNKYDRFFNIGDVLFGWELYDSILEHIKDNNIQPVVYKDAMWPIQSV